MRRPWPTGGAVAPWYKKGPRLAPVKAFLMYSSVNTRILERVINVVTTQCAGRQVVIRVGGIFL